MQGCRPSKAFVGMALLSGIVLMGAESEMATAGSPKTPVPQEADDVTPAGHTKIEPALAAVMARMAEDSLTPVMIWMSESAVPEGARPDVSAGSRDADSPGSQEEDAERTRRGTVMSLVAPLVAFLEVSGVEASADAYAPVVYAALTPSLIREIADRADVQMVYLDEQNVVSSDQVGALEDDGESAGNDSSPTRQESTCGVTGAAPLLLTLMALSFFGRGRAQRRCCWANFSSGSGGRI